MPRRKQQAPKRAAVYMPDDDVSPQGSSVEGEGDKYNPIREQQSEEPEPKEPADKGVDSKSSDSNRNSPVSVLSNQEAELESRLSDVSDRLSDRSDSSSQSQDEERKDSKVKDEANSSLGKMRATYANFLSDSYWTQIGLDLKVGNKASRGSCDSTNESTKSEFDWHQDALSKTFQQACSPKPVSKPSLFSSVHLQRQTSKTCGSIFTGASRFRCRECSSAYDTLVELTVHMNKSGHYRDDNHTAPRGSESSSKVRKRNLQVLEGKEDAQKVLKCMFCGHSFDALQDLSVHMIKTKHYQKVPLKEPIPVMPPKLVPHAKKRPYEAPRPCSPDSTTGAVASSNLQRPYVSQNSQGSSGYQNGASYTFQFEACKSQILKCMECGSSHDTLQQLTTHMMVTGHFVKVTNSASKKGKLLALNPVAVGKMQSLAESPENETLCGAEGDKSLPKSVASSDTEMDIHREETERKEKGNRAKENGDDKQSTEDEKAGGGTFKFQYLREEDLGQASGGEGDILKSLANTVTTAINKAQTGTPSWSAYPSIHAAYQFSGAFKNSTLSTSQPVQLKQTLNSKLRLIAPKGKSHQNASGAKCFPLQHYNMDIKKENGSTFTSEESQNAKSEDGGKECSDSQEVSSELCADKAEEGDGVIRKNLSPHISHKKGKEYPYSPISNGCSNASALASDTHETLRTNPLSALQSVLNNHLGKANASSKRRSEASLAPSARSMHSRLSVNLEKAALAMAPSRASRMLFPCESNDQPIDLTKSKKQKPNPPCMQSCTPVQQKHALSDIADMVKILPKATTPKPSQPSKLTTTKLETDGQCFEDASPKRKGRQSNWNPQHLLILQAQFASSLFLTTEGKYLLSDLSPQERMHISKFTGLSMTTISHWLANVKYQLRKTGGTKFLKNMDTGYPVLHCNDCASKFRNPSAFITHLESHLGFQIKDMNKLPVKHEMQAEPEFSKAVMAGLTETQITEDEMDSKYKCKICCRSFVSNHAVKLHLSKTHCKSPENHSQFVEMDNE